MVGSVDDPDRLRSVFDTRVTMARIDRFPSLRLLHRSIIAKLPGMRADAPKRNSLIGLGYLLLSFVLFQLVTDGWVTTV